MVLLLVVETILGIPTAFLLKSLAVVVMELQQVVAVVAELTTATLLVALVQVETQLLMLLLVVHQAVSLALADLALLMDMEQVVVLDFLPVVQQEHGVVLLVMVAQEALVVAEVVALEAEAEAAQVAQVVLVVF